MTKRNETQPEIKVDARHISRAGQEDLRCRGMEMLKAGVSQTQVARNLGVHRQCVIRWKKRLEQFDFEQAVKNEKRGPKPGNDKRAVLTAAQQRSICQTIIDKNPAQLKFEFALWTTKAIQLLIKKRFQIDIKRRTLCNYLKAWGFSVQRPAKRAIQQDPKAVADWLENQYPAIERKAKSENALIYWEDETGISQDSNWVRGFAPVGQTPILPHNKNVSHGAPTMISAVNNQGRIHFRFEKQTVNAESYLQFLKDLLKDNDGRKIYVIADNARIHHAKIVRQWAEDNKDKIELYFLPAYTPERNPDEYVNRQLKTELRLKPSMTHVKALSVAEAFMNKLKGCSNSVKRIFDSPLVRYAREGTSYSLLAISYSKLMPG